VSWETALLGTIIFDPASYHEAGDLIPSDFTGYNQLVWAEISHLPQHDNAIDSRAIIESLRNSVDWRRLGGDRTPEEYLATLINDRGATPAVYAKEILDASIRRNLQQNIAMIAAAAVEEGRSIEELLDYSETKIMALRRNRDQNGFSMADLMGLFIPRLEGMLNGTITPIWRPKVLQLQEVISYIEDTETIIVAARPGQGKSSYIRYEFLKEARMNGKKMVIFNLDNDKMDYARAFVSLDSNIPNTKLRNPQLLSAEEMARVRQSAENVAALPIRIEQASGLSALEITRKARELKQKGELDIMAVDYIQQVNNGKQSRNDDVGFSISTIRNFGMRHGIPQFIASQLSRDIERRNGGGNAEPQLSDLRDSGTLEQDASIIIFPRVTWGSAEPVISEQQRFPENMVNGRFLERPIVVPIRFFVLKNRNDTTGATGEIAWNKSTGNYYQG